MLRARVVATTLARLGTLLRKRLLFLLANSNRFYSYNSTTS